MHEAGFITEENHDSQRIVLHPEKSFYNGVYLRSYEPDYVKRAKSRGASTYYKDHLQLQPFEGNPELVFKSLLRKRDLSQERARTKSTMQGKTENSMLDTSGRDMSLYHHPDFRVPPENQYQTVYSPKEDKEREKSFRLRLKTKYGGQNLSQPWVQNAGSIYRKDPYIDGFEEVGKHERSKSPMPQDQTTNIQTLLIKSGVLSETSLNTTLQKKKEFIVTTSKMKTTMIEQEHLSRSLRKLENQMMRTSRSFKNYYQALTSPIESQQNTLRSPSGGGLGSISKPNIVFNITERSQTPHAHIRHSIVQTPLKAPHSARRRLVLAESNTSMSILLNTSKQEGQKSWDQLEQKRNRGIEKTAKIQLHLLQGQGILQEIQAQGDDFIPNTQKEGDYCVISNFRFSERHLLHWQSVINTDYQTQAYQIQISALFSLISSFFIFQSQI